MIPYIIYTALLLAGCIIFYKLLLQKETGQGEELVVADAEAGWRARVVAVAQQRKGQGPRPERVGLVERAQFAAVDGALNAGRKARGFGDRPALTGQ